MSAAKKSIAATFNASLLNSSGIAAVFAQAAVSMTTALNPLPFVPPDFGKPITEMMKQRPLTAEQADNLLTKAFDAQLDGKTYTDQQIFAARFYLRAEMDGLPGITQTLLKRHDSQRVMDEVLERLAMFMARPGFAELMAAHSPQSRQLQDKLYAQEVGAQLGGSHAQVKAPPRASFTRNRSTVTA